jgi:hypothetical protein
MLLIDLIGCYKPSAEVKARSDKLRKERAERQYAAQVTLAAAVGRGAPGAGFLSGPVEVHLAFEGRGGPVVVRLAPIRPTKYSREGVAGV